MPTIFEALPGMEVPVAGITQGFEQLRSAGPAADQTAMQLNLVLHFGLGTTTAEALEQFQTAVRFGQRYPCRVVVLCPLRDDTGKVELRAKIYGECFLGKTEDDTRCIEIVSLCYPPEAKSYLQDQVTICLSTDLPLYYWAHHFTSSKRLSTYHYLLTRSQRVIFDSAIVSPDALTFDWPNLSAVRDLAYTRTLPLRQNIGQFLSRYAPPLLIDGLQRVTIRHRAALSAEASCLLNWVKKGLVRSGASLDQGIAFIVTPVDCAGCFSLELAYANAAKHFRWAADLSTDHAAFSGDLGTGRTTQAAGARFLTPEAALGEAMFF